ncbi:flagellar hook-length control protein FliK [Roseovarius sp.]
MILPDTASMLAAAPRPAQDPVRIGLSSDAAAHASFQVVFSDLSGAMTEDVPVEAAPADDIAPLIEDASTPPEPDIPETPIQPDSGVSLAADPAHDARSHGDPVPPRDPGAVPNDPPAEVWPRDAQRPVLAATPKIRPIGFNQPSPTLPAMADRSGQPAVSVSNPADGSVSNSPAALVPTPAAPLAPDPAASFAPDPTALPASDLAPDTDAKGDPRLPDRASTQATLSPFAGPLRSDPSAPFTADSARVIAPPAQRLGLDASAVVSLTSAPLTPPPTLNTTEARFVMPPAPHAPLPEPVAASLPLEVIIGSSVARRPSEQPPGSGAPPATLAQPIQPFSPVLAPKPDPGAIAPKERLAPNDPVQTAQAPVTPHIALPTPQPLANQAVQPFLAQPVQSLPQPIVDGWSDPQTYVSDPAQNAEIRPVSDLPNAARGFHDILHRPELPRQVLMQLVAAIQRAPGEKNLDLTLNPAELGRVRISLAPGDAGIVVTIIAERPETLDLMRRHAETLAQDFLGMGYGRAEFNFGQTPQHSGQRGNSGTDTIDRQATAPEPPAHSVASVHISNDRVDIRL